ncbi:MAG: S4 domain-containing protein [Bacteroidales bacterium]|uniref:S4 domain-containing protein n=1 Tax=Porphyromonas sp. TaxID=1924944 RepID=UPI002973FE3E|nr:S4 domain-containing protein [Porphyromonas sp.]MDD7437323.1 S4 domain-containing protein [Bacteroidales bacterium]MDY3067422.1 S4 domain-containing protein [Porphyromonas sp.]
MEVRISRIVSEYYEYTRRDAEELLRQGRIKLNDQIAGIGDKASVEDIVTLDDVVIPLKGLFRKFSREAAERQIGEKYGIHKSEERNYSDNPKSRDLRKGRKDNRKKRHGKNYEEEY